MNMNIPIVEILRNGEIKGRGEFEFRHKPGKGDRIVIPSGTGDIDIMEVLYLEHSPVLLPRKFYNEDKKPSIRLYVKFLDEYYGEICE